MWFVLVPGEMFAAYYFSPPRFRMRSWLIAGAAVLGPILLFMVFKMGLSWFLLFAFGVALAQFLLTSLIFRFNTGSTRIGALCVVEEFLLGVLYFKMLNFARSDEELARQSSGLAQIIFIVAIVAFLVHSIVLYLSMFGPADRKRGKKELFLFLSLIVPLALVVMVALPPDFISHSVVFNRLNPEPTPQPVPLDERGYGSEDGNLRSERYRRERGDQGQGGEDGEEGEGEEGRPREGRGRRNRLEGIGADQWENRRGQDNGEGDGPARQYAVMVIASPSSPVYAATSYYGELDAERGFQLSRDEPLNDLAYRRLLETWVDPDEPLDASRREVPVFTLSTIPDRTLAYRPYRVAPTVLDRQYHPFSYSFDAVSQISSSSYQEWQAIDGLLPSTREALAEYLEVPLSEPALDLFQAYLDEVLGGITRYAQKIEAILGSYSTFQYELGFDDDVSVARLMEFLGDTRSGDCSEFSNTTAILARLAGIPSRVVVGYVASPELQTESHREGIFVLREMIEPLQRFELDDLYLVTNMHHHSWTQLYMPGYGWVDFETTDQALPPTGEGDPNQMNVVIPIIDPQANPAESYPFPWLFVLKALLVILAAVAVALWLYRCAKETYLEGVSHRRDERGLRALLKLFLMRLAADGHVVKNPAETPLEYARRYPRVRGFAELYTTLRYRDRYMQGEEERFRDRIREAYRETVRSARKPGVGPLLRRIFSLKGLYY
ncbi:hypothetical protein ES707_05856 [subsurface metagenome]